MPLSCTGDDLEKLDKLKSEVTKSGDANDEDLMVTQHNEVPIIYHEWGRFWSFELFGKEHQFPHLRDCKEFIDKPPKDADPKRVFKRQKAILGSEYGRPADGFKKVEVTSVASNSGYDKSVRYWVTHTEDKRREVVGAKGLLADTPENEKNIADFDLLRESEKAIQSRINATIKKLKPFRPS